MSVADNSTQPPAVPGSVATQPPGTPPEGTPPAPPAAPKGQLAERIAAAKTSGKPEDLVTLLDEVYGELGNTRYESMTRRQQLRQLEQEKAALEEAKTAAERAKMTDLERIQAEKQDLEAKFNSLNEKIVDGETREALREAGIVDLKSAMLHWKALTAEQKAATSLDAFAESLKKEFPHLAAPAAPPVAPPSGPNPNPPGDGVPPATNSGPPSFSKPEEFQSYRNTLRSQYS